MLTGTQASAGQKISWKIQNTLGSNLGTTGNPGDPDSRIKKMWHTHKMKYYAVIKIGEELTHATSWMTLC